MTHSICSSEAGGEMAYFQRLWRTLFAHNLDPKTRLELLLEQETTEFGLDYAFLTQIDLESGTERFELVHGSHEQLTPKSTVPLSKTYCRKTIANSEGTLAISDAIAEGWEHDPAYETFGIETYLGTTISIDGELYGTLSFADVAAREEPIREKEKALIEMHAQWVEYTASLWDGLPTQGVRLDPIEGRTVSAEAIDSMMGALRRRSRRVILMTLLENSAETDIDIIERRLNHEHTSAQLFHSDLPKLADDGYIEWDDESNIISKGPNFSEVEPLVQLLREYNSSSFE